MYNKIKQLGFKLKQVQGVNENDVKEFEESLSVKVGEEYKNFLLEFGSLEVEYFEFYGYVKNNTDLLNAVSLTLQQRKNIENFPKDLIVFYNGGDGSIYCINSNDEIFRCIYNRCSKLDITFKEFLFKKIESLS